MNERPRVLIFDGYLDEPAALGVPPYISPLVRAVAGAAIDADADVDYISIDHLRGGQELPPSDILVVIGGSSVPGRYLRSMPASIREMERVIAAADSFVLLGASAAGSRLADLADEAVKDDPAAAVHDILIGEYKRRRWRTLEEWNRWMLLGAAIVRKHRDFPQPLIAELESYRGCHRFYGGCSFCVEPLKGRPLMRAPEDIIAELRELKRCGVRNARLGGQTSIVSYHAEGDPPRPDVEAVGRLFRGLKKLEMNVLHVDNGNPAVIASYPSESREVLNIIAESCTPGNVIALGLESADPEVKERNRLNATPEQTAEAVRIINEAGRERGENGMPRLLPGINFIAGLDGESRKTYDLNYQFLERLRQEGLLLRRINIRQVIPSRREYDVKVDKKLFLAFKEKVRQEIDLPMLREMLPFGTVLRKVYTEIHRGALTFGRQIGSYPLLVAIPYKTDLNTFIDVAVTDWGPRSVSAVEYPFEVNSASLSALASLPGIGKKRAAKLFTSQPMDENGFISVVGDAELSERLLPLLSFSTKGK
ncbi:MAG TPA: radical SAM protein [Candidatus Methanomethylophilaceae archaeon]|nr:radical SAM protein [Candidatus Methanomethylophilaceae archaeon]